MSAAISTGMALIVLCVKVDEHPATRNDRWILVGMLAASFAIEIVDRGVTRRKMRLTKRTASGSEPSATDQP